MTNMTTQSSRSEPDHGSEQDGSTFADKLAKRTNETASQTVERMQRARERLDKRLVEQRSNLVQRVRGVSRVLAGGGTMLGDDDEFGARGLHYVSERLERVASYLDALEPNSLATDLRGLARDRPAWFFGSAFTLGLLLGRFAHSTGATVGGSNSTRADGKEEPRTASSPRPAQPMQVTSAPRPSGTFRQS